MYNNFNKNKTFLFDTFMLGIFGFIKYKQQYSIAVKSFSVCLDMSGLADIQWNKMCLNSLIINVLINFNSCKSK